MIEYKFASVPVMFWGHMYPGDPTHPWDDTFHIRYNPKTGWWTYTSRSSLRADTPYSKWIDETFKPDYKKLDEGVEHITIIRELIMDRGVPVLMKFGLQKKLKFPEELKKQLSEWKYWLDEPEPDTSAYYVDIDLDHDQWQCEDALVKKRGDLFTEEEEKYMYVLMKREGYAV